jgi:lysyl-tRNA synthetase, class II
MRNKEEIFTEEELLVIKQLKEENINPYPIISYECDSFDEIKDNFSEESEPKEVKVAGRIITKREHGKASFITILNNGSKIQIYLRINTIGEEKYGIFKKFITVGDFIATNGVVFKTHTGEITVEAKDLTLLSKSLVPLPEKWHGIENPEVRFRHRYLDLIINPESWNIFETRSKIISQIRNTLGENSFIEVETPTLQEVYGGALAKPFTTHHNALDEDLFLRIAPELYLKRLIIGGFNKVFEIGKAFRNEGISTHHNPEFTILELYQAYADYKDIMKVTENIFFALMEKVVKSDKIEYKGDVIDFKSPFRRLSLKEAFDTYANVDIDKLKDLDYAKSYISKEKITIDKNLNWANIVDETLKKKIEPNLIQPTFLYDYPLPLSPLAKKKENDENWVERFQPIIAGMEVGNAFTELNDPIDQFERFSAQEFARKSGDLEAHSFDKEYIEAMKIGLPPTGGLGLGIDRIVMLLTGKESIREVLLFPQLRRKDKSE